MRASAHVYFFVVVVGSLNFIVSDLGLYKHFWPTGPLCNFMWQQCLAISAFPSSSETPGPSLQAADSMSSWTCILTLCLHSHASYCDSQKCLCDFPGLLDHPHSGTSVPSTQVVSDTVKALGPFSTPLTSQWCLILWMWPSLHIIVMFLLLSILFLRLIICLLKKFYIRMLLWFRSKICPKSHTLVSELLEGDWILGMWYHWVSPLKGLYLNVMCEVKPGGKRWVTVALAWWDACLPWALTPLPWPSAVLSYLGASELLSETSTNCEPK